MGFRRSQTPEFMTEVTVNVPNARGVTEKQTYSAIFHRATTDQLATLRNQDDIDVCRKQLKGWEMEDPDTRQPVPFTPEELEACLQVSQFPRATALAFFEASRGARLGNS